ncbi:hypothetical protein D3C81_1430870 [compost metagenome]
MAARLPQAEAAGQADLAAREQAVAAHARADAIAQLDALPGGQRDALRQVVELQLGRHMVEHLQPARRLRAGGDAQQHLAAAIQRQVAGQLALELRRRQAAQPQRVEQCQRADGQQRAPPQAVAPGRQGEAEQRQGAEQDGRQ